MRSGAGVRNQKPRRTRALIVSALVLLAMVATACTTPTAPGSTAPENRMAGQIVERLNAERIARGLPALVWDQQLTELSYEWSQAMAFYNNFVHRPLRPLFDNPAYNQWSGLGENIFRSTSSNVTSGYVNLAFMYSNAHRNNVLNRGYDSIGVGVVCAANGTMWVTENFGRRAGSALPAIGSSPLPAAAVARPIADGSTCLS